MIFMIFPADSLRSILSKEEIVEDSGFTLEVTDAKSSAAWWA
jgi:hypothetical protein